MHIKKISYFVLTGLITTIMMMGCNSETSVKYNPDSNTTVPDIGEGEEGSFSGEVLGNFLEELAGGAGGEIGSDVVGNLLALLGWGDSGDNKQDKMLENIDNKLDLIAGEISSLENEFSGLAKEILTHEDTNLIQDLWPKTNIKNIKRAKGAVDAMRYDNNETVGLGEGNKTKIRGFASTWIDGDINEGMKDIDGIYDSINGTASADDIGIFSLYTKRALRNLGVDQEYLFQGYKSLESFASQLLGYQATAINYTVDSYKALDDNVSAQKRFNCFYETNNEADSCNILYNEVGNMNYNYSFMYNAISLVLHDAPIYDPFLHPVAEEILKRAEFYNLTVRGAKAYGLHIFHISTADMSKSPDTLYVAKDKEKLYPCTSSRYVVEGRQYDFWTEGNKVKPSTDYNVVEYVCDAVPNGNYVIYESDALDAKDLGVATVEQYDTSYEQNSSGKISYGFTLLTNNMPNHYPLSSPNWSIQKPKSDNYHSHTDIHFPKSWSIVTKAEYNDATLYKSKARVELDGHFNYNGDHSKTMTIDYKTQFYVKAKSEYADAYAYSHYTIGVYDSNDEKVVTEKENYTLKAGPGHSYDGTKTISNHMSFTAKPGHGYYIYINMVSTATNEDGGDDQLPYAETNLNSVYYIHMMFENK
jgi:hypothetical protein